MKKVFSLIWLLAIFSLLYGNESYLEKANRYFQQKKFSLAEVFYKKVIEKAPDNLDANFNLGKIYYYKENYDQALKYLKRAYDIKPSQEILFIIGNCYVGLNNGNMAISIYSNILKTNPDYADVYLNAGLVAYKYLYNKQQTIYFWEKFLQLKPDDTQAPAIKKALQYLKDPDFVLSPPSRTTKSISNSNKSVSNKSGVEEDFIILPKIKGKDIKTTTETKYKLKGKKSITTD